MSSIVMTNYMIAEMFHGLMHFHKNMWEVDPRGMSIADFIEINKTNLNNITAELRRDHKLSVSQTTKPVLSMGIRRYLIGENIPIIDNPLQHPNKKV